MLRGSVQGMKKGFTITRFATVCAVLLAALAAAGPARADLIVGVADDGGKIAPDGGDWFLSQMREVGLQENRITVAWDPENPTAIHERERLDRYIPKAAASGIRIMLLISPSRARALAGSRTAVAQFVAFVTQVARTYPQVKDIAVGNEPNQPRFWQPQFSNTGKSLACGVVSARPRTGLRRAEGRRARHHRDRRLALAARERQCTRGRERLDVAGPLHPRHRARLPRERP